MEIAQLVKMVDHTVLKAGTSKGGVIQLCDEAARYGFASVCIPPVFVDLAAGYLKGSVAVCTVVGFPLGYNCPEIKLAEAKKALADGADELDMVLNIGRLQAGDADYVLTEISQIKQLCGDRVLKVIIEACLLSEKEKILACDLVTRAGADFIKTSTGFAAGGATVEDIRLLCRHVGPGVKVKAAGGIREEQQARQLALAGARRLGMSGAIRAFALG